MACLLRYRLRYFAGDEAAFTHLCMRDQRGSRTSGGAEGCRRDAYEMSNSRGQTKFRSFKDAQRSMDRVLRQPRAPSDIPSNPQFT
jgi:hypothetical protein